MRLPNEPAYVALQLIRQIDIHARARVCLLFLWGGQAVANHVFANELREVYVAGES